MFIPLLAIRFFSAGYRYFFGPPVSVSALSGLRILSLESWARIFFSEVGEFSGLFVYPVSNI